MKKWYKSILMSTFIFQVFCYGSDKKNVYLIIATQLGYPISNLNDEKDLPTLFKPQEIKKATELGGGSYYIIGKTNFTFLGVEYQKYKLAVPVSSAQISLFKQFFYKKSVMNNWKIYQFTDSDFKNKTFPQSS